MKKTIFLVSLLLVLSSCATLYPGKSYNRAKPKKIKNKSYQIEYLYKDDCISLEYP